jgi:hypothetical protein
MAFAFSDLQSEVLRRGVRDESGTQFNTAAANLVNTAMWTVARSARWKQLRRETTFNTVGPYQVGVANVINNSSSVTLTTATLLTNNIQIGQYITLGGSATYYRILQVNSQTTLTLDQPFTGVTANGVTYGILPLEYYTLPIQIGHEAFFWHRAYGYPLMMTYVPSQDFYMSGVLDVLVNVPLGYRMWGCDASINQPKQPGILSYVSTSTADTSSVSITVAGQTTITNSSNGTSYLMPATETVNLNGTTPVSGTLSFTSVDIVTKNTNTAGAIKITSDSGYTNIGMLPMGNTTTGPLYTKIQLYPLPYLAFPIRCLYYKLPFKMVNAGDVHELGEEFDEAIILLATAKIKAEQGLMQDSQNFIMMYKDEITTLRRTNVDKIDWYPKLQAPKGNYWNAWTGGLRYAQVGGQGQFGPQSAV